MPRYDLNLPVRRAFAAFETAAFALASGDDEGFEAARDQATNAVRDLDTIAVTLRAHFRAAFSIDLDQA